MVTRGRLRIVANLAAGETVVPVDGVPSYQVMTFGGAEVVAGGVRLSGHSVGIITV